MSRGVVLITLRRSNGVDGRHVPKVGFLIGRRGSLESCSLDLGAGHALAKKRLSSQKEFVVVSTGIVTAGEALESVCRRERRSRVMLAKSHKSMHQLVITATHNQPHNNSLTEIELTLERGQLGLLEILLKNMIDKLLGLVHNKAPTVWLPGNHVRMTILLNLIQHGMKFHGKGNRDASTTALGRLRRRYCEVAIARVVVIMMFHKVTVIVLGRLSWLLRLTLTSRLLEFRKSHLLDGRDRSATLRNIGFGKLCPEEQGATNALREL